MAELKYIGSTVNSVASQVTNIAGKFDSLCNSIKTSNGVMFGRRGFDLINPGVSADSISQGVGTCGEALGAFVKELRTMQVSILTYSQDSDEINAFIDSLSRLEFDSLDLSGIDSKISFWKKLEFAAKGVFASAGTFAAGFVEGVANFVETAVDTAAVVATGAASVFTKPYDLIAGTNITDEMWDTTKAYVAEEQVASVFDDFYANTELGQSLKNNAYGFDTVRGIGKGVGYSTTMILAGNVFAGMGGVSAATKAARVAKALPAMSGILGFGNATEEGWGNGASTEKGLMYGVAGGAWEAVQWGVGVKIGSLGSHIDDIAQVGAKQVFKDASKRVMFDTVDSGLEGFVQPALTMIYREYDGDTLAAQYANAFEVNGGWNGVLQQAAIGGIMSGASEAGDVFKFKVKTKKTTAASKSSKNTVKAAGTDSSTVVVGDGKSETVLKTKISDDVDTRIEVKENGSDISTVQQVSEKNVNGAEVKVENITPQQASVKTVNDTGVKVENRTPQQASVKTVNGAEVKVENITPQQASVKIANDTGVKVENITPQQAPVKTVNDTGVKVENITPQQAPVKTVNDTGVKVENITSQQASVKTVNDTGVKVENITPQQVSVKNTGVDVVNISGSMQNSNLVAGLESVVGNISDGKISISDVSNASASVAAIAGLGKLGGSIGPSSMGANLDVGVKLSGETQLGTTRTSRELSGDLSKMSATLPKKQAKIDAAEANLAKYKAEYGNNADPKVIKKLEGQVSKAKNEYDKQLNKVREKAEQRNAVAAKEVESKLETGDTKGLVGTEKRRMVDGEISKDSAKKLGEIDKKEFSKLLDNEYGKVDKTKVDELGNPIEAKSEVEISIDDNTEKVEFDAQKTELGITDNENYDSLATKLDKAVEDGKLTREQANSMFDKIANEQHFDVKEKIVSLRKENEQYLKDRQANVERKELLISKDGAKVESVNGYDEAVKQIDENIKANNAEITRLEKQLDDNTEVVGVKAEEEARIKAEEEARIKTEEEARIKAEEEARIKVEEEARIKAEEEARIKAEEEARLKAEEEARIKAEEEARIKAEEEARIKAEEEARIKAEEEARIKAEEEARIKAEEEARIKAEVSEIDKLFDNGIVELEPISYLKRTDMAEQICDHLGDDYTVGMHGIGLRSNDLDPNMVMSSICNNGLNVKDGRTIHGTVTFFGKPGVNRTDVINNMNLYRYGGSNQVIVATPTTIRNSKGDMIYIGGPNPKSTVVNYETGGYDTSSFADSCLVKGDNVPSDFIYGYFTDKPDGSVEFNLNPNHVSNNGGIVSDEMFDYVKKKLDYEFNSDLTKLLKNEPNVAMLPAAMDVYSKLEAKLEEPSIFDDPKAVRRDMETVLQYQKDCEGKIDLNESARPGFDSNARVEIEENAGVIPENEVRVDTDDTRIENDSETRVEVEENTGVIPENEVRADTDDTRIETDSETRVEVEENSDVIPENEVRADTDDTRIETDSETRVEVEENTGVIPENEVRVDTDDTRIETDSETRVEVEENAGVIPENEVRVDTDDTRIKTDDELARLAKERDVELDKLKQKKDKDIAEAAGDRSRQYNLEDHYYGEEIDRLKKQFHIHDSDLDVYRGNQLDIKYTEYELKQRYENMYSERFRELENQHQKRLDLIDEGYYRTINDINSRYSSDVNSIKKIFNDIKGKVDSGELAGTVLGGKKLISEYDRFVREQSNYEADARAIREKYGREMDQAVTAYRDSMNSSENFHEQARQMVKRGEMEPTYYLERSRYSDLCDSVGVRNLEMFFNDESSFVRRIHDEDANFILKQRDSRMVSIESRMNQELADLEAKYQDAGFDVEDKFKKFELALESDNLNIDELRELRRDFKIQEALSVLTDDAIPASRISEIKKGFDAKLGVDGTTSVSSTEQFHFGAKKNDVAVDVPGRALSGDSIATNLRPDSNGAGTKSIEIQPDGSRVQQQINANGDIQKHIVKSDGTEIDVTYSNDGFILKQRELRPDGTLISKTNNKNGSVREITYNADKTTIAKNTDIDGNVKITKFNEKNVMVEQTENLVDGTIKTKKVQADGSKVVKVVDPDGHSIESIINLDGKEISSHEINSDGTYIYKKYDVSGNVIEKISNTKTGIVNIETYHDDLSYTIRSIETNNTITETTYDKNGYVQKESLEYPNGTKFENITNADGTKTYKTVNPDKTYDSKTVNSNGIILSKEWSDSEGTIRKQKHLSDGTVTRHTETSNGVIRDSVFKNKDLVNQTEIRPDGSKQYFTRNADGSTRFEEYRTDETIKTTDNKVDGTFESKIVDKNGNTIENSWSYSNGTVITEKYGTDGSTNRHTVDASGKFSDTEFDKYGNIIKETEGLGDNISKITEYKSNGSVKVIEYKSDGSTKVLSKYADGTYESRIVDKNGKLLETVWYDSRGTLRKEIPNVDGTKNRHTVDANGNVRDSVLRNNELISQVETRPDGSKQTFNKDVDGTYERKVTDKNGYILEREYKDRSGTHTLEQLNKDGTHTAHSRKTDGSNIDTVFDKDGIIRRVENRADGTRKIIERTVDGGKVITEINRDGSSVRNIYDKYGNEVNHQVNDTHQSQQKAQRQTIFDRFRRQQPKVQPQQIPVYRNAQEVISSLSNPLNEQNLGKIVRRINDGKPDSTYRKIVSVNTTTPKTVPSIKSVNEFHKRFGIDRSIGEERYYNRQGYRIYHQGEYFDHISSRKFEYHDVTDRLYLNISDFNQSYKFCELFATECEKKGIPFYLKTASAVDGNRLEPMQLMRDESIVIYSGKKYLSEYANIASEIVAKHGIKLEEPPILTGKLKNNIGYGAEPKISRESFNSIRSKVIDAAMRDVNSEYLQRGLRINSGNYLTDLKNKIIEYGRRTGIDVSNFCNNIE